MSPTGAPLMILVVLGTVLALAATVVTWNRGGRLRLLRRTTAVLLTEALLLFSVGLVVNRSQGFYAAWSDLSRSTATDRAAPTAVPGDLDRWLRTDAGKHPDASLPIVWQPRGWTGWRLATAPVVVIPPGYLRHPRWRYPALVVIDGTADWTPAAEVAAARKAAAGAGPAVVLFARTTPATRDEVVAVTLPAALTRDLRVTGRHWALVASASDAALAERTITAAPARYPAAALVPGAAATVTAQQALSRSGGAVPAAWRELPAGVEVAVVGRAAPLPAGWSGNPPPAHLAADPATALPTALDWACHQTPPPLAVPAPAVSYVPVHRGRRHVPHHPSTTVRAGARSGGSRASGQPHR
ncbi:hypothetical protein [Actinoplanes sp. NPDC049681]|uniref:hypothetical protein n=1 Tax=Actinoplanes sp. NPDC049681 TaxID=3363905 RepID=UPI0037B88FC0